MSIQEVYTIIEEKNKEYRDLANRFRNVCNDLDNKDKEIERLNNIINEIEQYCLDEQIPEEYPDYNDFTEIFNSIYDTIYNKIQQLKGSDKE